uniref:Uncharacterized protein n=1 Tax=Oryza rufipogon TaxID=4529 RepID=A0A0E0NLY8_ORYRU
MARPTGQGAMGGGAAVQVAGWRGDTDGVAMGNASEEAAAPVDLQWGRHGRRPDGWRGRRGQGAMGGGTAVQVAGWRGDTDGVAMGNASEEAATPVDLQWGRHGRRPDAEGRRLDKWAGFGPIRLGRRRLEKRQSSQQPGSSMNQLPERLRR